MDTDKIFQRQTTEMQTEKKKQNTAYELSQDVIFDEIVNYEWTADKE